VLCLFDRGVILCDVWYLFFVSYCKPLPPGKNPFAVNKYYITLHYMSQKKAFFITTAVKTSNPTIYKIDILISKISTRIYRRTLLRQ
jgi:hypothetical protein